MFIPNTTAMLYRKRKTRNIYGKEDFDKGTRIPCGVVNIASLVELSSVRADSTESRGAAEEVTAAPKILVPAYVDVKKGDVLELYGLRLEVTSAQPRISILGSIDHYEIKGKIKREK